jgi:hypothetical protein
MTEMKFAVSLAISIVFVLLKVVEMKVFDGKKKALKPVLKDSIVVFMSCLGGMFVMDQVSVSSSTGSAASNVFVDAPNF